VTSDFLRVSTDLHSHLVPGVDDGARTLDESIEAVGRLSSLGVRRIVTTPHLVGSLTRDPGALAARMGEIAAGWASLADSAGRAFPDLDLRLGYEIMLDIPDPDLSDPRLRLGDTSYVLVEWPGLQVPPATLPAIERLVEGGVKPVIAHPERYRGLDRDLNLPGEWKRKGAILQMNYGSLLGGYGKGPRDRALLLLERGWVDYFSSDFHGRAHLTPWIREARDALADLGGEEQFEILAEINPARVFKGQEPLQAPPLTVPQGVWEKLLAAIGRTGRS